MHNLMKSIILLLLPMLGGCAFTKALFFQSDQNSFHLKDAKATLFAFPDDGSGCPSS